MEDAAAPRRRRSGFRKVARAPARPPSGTQRTRGTRTRGIPRARRCPVAGARPVSKVVVGGALHAVEGGARGRGVRPHAGPLQPVADAHARQLGLLEDAVQTVARGPPDGGGLQGRQGRARRGLPLEERERGHSSVVIEHAVETAVETVVDEVHGSVGEAPAAAPDLPADDGSGEGGRGADEVTARLGDDAHARARGEVRVERGAQQLCDLLKGRRRLRRGRQLKLRGTRLLRSAAAAALGSPGEAAADVEDIHLDAHLCRHVEGRPGRPDCVREGLGRARAASDVEADARNV
mmetsp:Transcript_27862/g.81894  ORF Transcript_27862/g.81894 Transcript_27862/m.81894 type:complete len:293 (+) Transcript_27862:350-1228(+)